MVKQDATALELKGAGLGYGSHFVLRNVSLTVGAGEILCLLGRNGTGKTTLFRTILGFIRPLHGSVTIGGREIASFHPKELAKLVSYVPQTQTTPFPYTVEDVVLFGRTVHLGPFSSPGRRDRIIAAECLDLLGIAALGRRTFNELSGGERQMVVIARAMAQEARFLILDEPASHLDYGNQVRVLRKIRELGSRSVGILMATHHPDHAFMSATRVALMGDGTLGLCGLPEEMLTREMLGKLYDVEVQVFDAPLHNGRARRVCAPVMP